MDSDDVKLLHMEWLVERRSLNHRTLLTLYQLLHKYRDIINENRSYSNIFQSLVGASFSLWRAVFLSDVTDTRSLMINDVQNFLENLVFNNAVAYAQDRAARHWTFRYYVTSARERLNSLSEKYEELNLLQRIEEAPGLSAMHWWELHQNALDGAVNAFNSLLQGQENT